MTWAEGPWLGLDFESTGVDPLTARIVTACVAYRAESDPGWTKEWLADAGGEDIPEGATAIHGVTTERARSEGIEAIAVAEHVREHLQEAWANGVPVAGMNVVYDLTLLNAELVRADHRALSIDGPVLDVLVLDRQVEKYRKGSRKLDALCAHYGVAHTAAAPGEDASQAAGAHDATADVLASLRVLWRIGRNYPALAAMSLGDLHDAQAGWHREWAEHYAAYLESLHRPASIDTSWPLRTVEAAVA